jgi:hypothetical protein
MTTAVIKKKLHHFIEAAENKKIKAIYTLLEKEIQEEESSSSHWEDRTFVAEMNSRYRSYKDGSAKLISLDAVEKKARKAALKLKNSKAS